MTPGAAFSHEFWFVPLSCIVRSILPVYVPAGARFEGRAGLPASTVAVNQLARHPVMDVPEAV